MDQSFRKNRCAMNEYFFSKNAYQLRERFCVMRFVVKPEQTRLDLLISGWVASYFVQELVRTSFVAVTTLPQKQIVLRYFDGSNCCLNYFSGPNFGLLPFVRFKFSTRCFMEFAFVTLLATYVRVISK